MSDRDEGISAQEILDEAVRGAEGQPVSPDETSEMLGQLYYLLKDEQALSMLLGDEHLRHLLPSVSHLSRTSIADDKSIMLAKLHFRRALRLAIAKKGTTLQNLSAFDSWLNYGYAAIDDRNKGWRGRLATERIKTYKFERGEGGRRKILGIF